MRVKNIVGLSFVLLLSAPSAWAWGRRGHSMVCQTASYLVAEGKNATFFKEHSFDLGYYCNVPDFFWKRPATYNQEAPQHYINLEIFERALKGTDVKDPYALDRHTFEMKFPQVPFSAGRAWWRVREMDDLLMADRSKLMDTKLNHDDRFAAQGDWLLHAGVMGHYIGDLSMPLHVTENHDGDLTHQKGIHSFFEDKMVNDLFHGEHGFSLEAEVWKEASRRWKADHAKLEKMSVLELIRAETAESLKAAPELLKIDREVGRNDEKKAAQAYKKMIVQRIAAGAVYLAEYYRRALGFDFDGKKFYLFQGEPAYIKAGQ